MFVGCKKSQLESVGGDHRFKTPPRHLPMLRAEKGRGCPTGAEANLRDPPHLKSLAFDLDIRADTVAVPAVLLCQEVVIASTVHALALLCLCFDSHDLSVKRMVRFADGRLDRVGLPGMEM